MRRTPTAALLSLCLIGYLATPVSAQNLLLNPDFDTNLNDWDHDPADTVHDATVGASGLGSARWERTIEDEIGFIVSQCVEGIVAGGQYAFSGSIQFDEAPAGGSVSVVVGWQGSPGCSGLLLLEAGAPVSPNGGFQSSSGVAVAPPGAVSAQLLVVGGVAWPAGPVDPEGVFALTEGDYVVFADDMRLFLESVPVPTAGLLWRIVLALALITAAGLSLRRFSAA